MLTSEMYKYDIYGTFPIFVFENIWLADADLNHSWFLCKN